MDRICKLRPKAKIYLLFALSVAFFSFLMYCVPMASDDYEFSALEVSGIADILNYALYYGNGRLLGNLGAVSLVQMPALAVLVKAFIISGIIFLVPAVLDIVNPAGYLLSFLLFVTIPPSLFGAVYTWTSGFQNYIPPIWTTLVILLLLRKYDNLRTWWMRGLYCVAIFLLGVAGQLFVEHCSVVNLVLAGCLVFYRHRTGRGIKPAVVWLVAAIIGALCMTLIPVVFFVEGNRTGSYRSVNVDGIVQILVSSVCAFAALGAAFPFTGVLTLSGFTVITTYLTGSSRSKKWNTFLYCASTLVVLYIMLNELLLHNEWYGGLATVRNGITACFAVLPFLLWPIALYTLEDKCLRGKIYFLLGLALLSLLPFLIVTPTPDRVVFLAYVCTVAAILLFSRYLARKAGDRITFWLRRSMRYAAALVILLLCITFANILRLGNIQETYIRREMDAGKTEIMIFRIPYDYVFWDGPGGFGRGYYYEKWYDIHFKQVEFPDWYNEYGQE